ncbi:MAG TPA: thioredoxin [Actinomycetota bacterium]|nr:thioredoxin [Actinomycetota bacterium]
MTDTNTNEIPHVGDADFDTQVLGAERPVLVDFWADWCVPCHMVSPVVEEIARENAGALKVAKLNVDDNPRTAQKYGVMSIPTLMLFKDGEERARVIGARGKDQILKEIQPHFA